MRSMLKLLSILDVLLTGLAGIASRDLSAQAAPSAPVFGRPSASAQRPIDRMMHQAEPTSAMTCCQESQLVSMSQSVAVMICATAASGHRSQEPAPSK